MKKIVLALVFLIFGSFNAFAYEPGYACATMKEYQVMLHNNGYVAVWGFYDSKQNVYIDMLYSDKTHKFVTLVSRDNQTCTFSISSGGTMFKANNLETILPNSQ